jgi:hypothetical protein
VLTTNSSEAREMLRSSCFWFWRPSQSRALHSLDHRATGVTSFLVSSVLAEILLDLGMLAGPARSRAAAALEPVCRLTATCNYMSRA